MRIKITIFALASTIILSGCCTGPGDYFEPKTNGVRNSQWKQMSAIDQDAIEVAFHEQQRLDEQLRLNKLISKQNKQVAKAERKMQAKQKERLNEERAHLKKEQENNTAKLQSIMSPDVPK